MTNGVLYGDDLMVEGVSIDTRTAKENDLFIAIQGKNFDGHNFVRECMEAKVAAMMVSHRLETNLAQVLVKDTMRALSDLAKAWRMRVSSTIIAVTGSNGKTTTREMIFSIMKQCKKAFASYKNYNNNIGVSLSLLGIRDADEAAVIEMGANHSGEIRGLCELARPDIGVVTNAGAAHLEGFGSLAGVARAKGELFEALGQNTVAVLNIDDAYSDYWRGVLKQHGTSCRLITFGIENPGDVSGRLYGADAEITINGQTRTLSLPLPGKHNLCNALAAAAAAYGAGSDIDAIIAGLEAMESVPGRLTQITGAHGVCLFDDTYNANPDSLSAGLEVLASHPNEKWLVLGDMSELGASAEQNHTQAGLDAKTMGVARLLTVGALARYAADAFGTGASHYESIDALLAELRPQVNASMAVLVKGSRVAGMEKVVEALR